MSVVLLALPTRQSRLVVAAVLCALAPGVQAQQAETGAAYQDHVLVVARTVHPRIAYRGIARQDNPVRVQATTFPGRVFHRTLDAALEQLVDDGDLDQVGSAGITGGVAALPVLGGGLTLAVGPGMPGGGSGSTAPLGSGAGSMVAGATRGLGNLIQGSLMPALNATPGGGR